MAIIEIQAKTMLASIPHPDPIFGLRYNMNLYRGCQHQCIYCDSRSECYQIENFNNDVLVKVNAIDLLQKELPRKRTKGVIGTGSMNDPYMPLEKRYNLTGRALELIARHGFGVHVITKSDLVVRDLEVISEIRRVHALITFTITTVDDELASKLEPGAPVSSRRLAAMRCVAERGIYTGVSMMPVLPFLEDSPENIMAIVQRAAENGASYIVPWFGLSMRDRQRAYLYGRLDALFPGLRDKYEKRYGERYDCPTPNAAHLREVFKETCAKYGLADRVPVFQGQHKPKQLELF